MHLRIELLDNETLTRAESEGNDEGLNFRVSAAFRREFRTYAAQHDLKLNELLRLAFDAYKSRNNEK